MDIAITLLIITTVLVMFWSIKVSKRFSVMVFAVIFCATAIAMIAWQGFTQQAFENIGFIALALFVMWLRFSKSIADTARARNWLIAKIGDSKYSKCEVCGKKLSYHRAPKNLSQLLLGGLTCENCGAEFDVPFSAFMPSRD